MASRDLVKKLNDCVKKAFDFQDQDNWAKDYKRISDFVNLKYSTRDFYAVNTYYNLVNLIVPNLYYQNPYITVKPRRTQSIYGEGGDYVVRDCNKQSVLVESVINKVIRDIGFEGEVRKCIVDCLIGGFGVLKLGYSTETAFDRDIEYNIKGNAYARRIDPLCFGFDPMGTSIADSRFAIHKFTKTKEEIKANKNYSGVTDFETDDDMNSKVKKNKETDYCTMYEIHDYETNKIHTFLKHGKKQKVVRSVDNPFDFKGSHFIILRLGGDTDCIRGTSMFKAVEDQVMALNEIFTMSMKHMQMFAGVVAYEQNALDDSQITAFENGSQGAMLECRPGSLTQSKVQRWSPLSQGAEYYNSMNNILNTIYTVLGVPDFQRPNQTRRMTATEVTYENSDANLRRAYFLSFVRTFALEAATKLTGIVQQFYDEEQEILIQGEFNEPVSYTKEDIQGEYDFDFDVNSMQFISQSRAQQLINALNIMASHPILQPMLQEIDQHKVAEAIFTNLDLKYSSFTKKHKISHQENNPYEENELVSANKRLPDPLTGEPHDHHINIHGQKAQEPLSQEQMMEIMRHIQMHEYLKSKENPQPMQGQQQQGMPQQGMQQPMEQALTEPEVQGDFQYKDVDNLNVM